jgi:hypothetical protein
LLLPPMNQILYGEKNIIWDYQGKAWRKTLDISPCTVSRYFSKKRKKSRKLKQKAYCSINLASGRIWNL